MTATFLVSLLQKLPPAARTIWKTVLYALTAGLIAVAFHFAIHLVYEHGLGRLAQAGRPVFLVGSFCSVVGGAALSGWLLSGFCRAAAGSGIPQLKAAFWRDFGLVSWRVVWVKFLGGMLSVGGGMSLGREGPSVQLGGGVASNLATLLGEPKPNHRPAAAAGAAAGLAAAFNTPIAAVTFVLEEIIGDLNSRLLGGVLLASVLGAFVTHGLLGEQPAFRLQPVGHVGWIAYVVVPVVASTAAVVGGLFQKATMGFRGWHTNPRRSLPYWVRCGAAGLATWAIGCAVYCTTGRLGIFSLGYDDLTGALNGTVAWRDAALLLGAKFLTTALCFGLGGCGGVFAPTLFFGAMTGVAAAGVLGLFVPLGAHEITLLAIVGMCSCLAAVVRAPVTSILIVFEMTHEFAVVPPLMVAVLLTQWIARRFSERNLYDEILVQDGIAVEHIMPPRDLRAWQEAPVGRIANFRPCLVQNTAPAALAELLAANPHSRFPVVQTDGRLVGVLSRAEAQAVADGAHPVKLVAAPSVRRDATIRDVQAKLIESPTGLVVVIAGLDERVIGLVTLHDLLRAQTALGDSDTG